MLQFLARWLPATPPTWPPRWKSSSATRLRYWPSAPRSGAVLSFFSRRRLSRGGL